MHPGVLIRFRPVGVLRMEDDGKQTRRSSACRPTRSIRPIPASATCRLPQVERDRIEAFFRVYKDLPKGRNPVRLLGSAMPPRRRH